MLIEKTWVTIWIFLISLPALAIPEPLRDIGGLNRPVLTRAVRLKHPFVIVADYDLLRRDFNQLAIYTDREIDAWLILNTAFISKTQAELGPRRRVHGKIEVTSEVVRAYRPYLYGRGLVYPVEGGLIDVKGAGSRSPRGAQDHDGLLSLGEAFYEYWAEKMIHAIFEKEGRYDTIESYAIIGFDIATSNIKWLKQPLQALILRQAHVRSTENWTCFSSSRALPIELLLRKYGISSVGIIDHINIQGAVANGRNRDALVDFGSINMRHVDLGEDFDGPIMDFVPDWTEERVLLSPEDSDYVRQPMHWISKELLEMVNLWNSVSEIYGKEAFMGRSTELGLEVKNSVRQEIMRFKENEDQEILF